MFRSKIFWGLFLGVVSSVSIFEGKTNLAYSPVWTRVIEVLNVPGTHFANSMFPSGIPAGGWGKFYSALAIGCNYIAYAIFWFAFLWVVAYFRERQHPYDRQHTLVPPTLR